MSIRARYKLDQRLQDEIRKQPEPFSNLFGKIVYLRTYSRTSADGRREKWADTVIRVVEGVMSAYQDYTGAKYDPQYADRMASKMAEAIFNMEFLPAGRGLWAMGTDLVYERGSAFLYNCSARWVRDPCEDFAWIMDMLMCGCGVGIRIDDFNRTALKPNKLNSKVFIVPDSREGWVSAIYKLLNAYLPDRYGNRGIYYTFDYSHIRAKGQPLKHFGGTASGYAPLAELINRVEDFLDQYADHKISPIRFCADVANCIGVCIVSGNVRRSSEILLCSVKSPYLDEFLNLKNYDRYPERSTFGYMSNNSLVLDTNDDFERYLPQIAQLISQNGEPGFINLQNIHKYGRYGDEQPDKADLCNPCGEIALENSEVCNLVEIMLPKFVRQNEFDLSRFLEVSELAHFYAKVVSLIPTHHKSINEIVTRNRRLGISLSGITQAYAKTGITRLISLMKKGYRHIKACDIILSAQLNVNQSVRLTTIKPSGTISQLVGITSGIHFPQYSHFIRRMRESSNRPLARALIKAGVPYEVSYYISDVQVENNQPQGFGFHLDNACLLEYNSTGEPIFDFDNLNYTNYVSIKESSEVQLTETGAIYKGCRIYRPETLVFEFVGAFPDVRPADEVSMWEQASLLSLAQSQWADNMISCTISFKESDSQQLEHLIALNAPIIKSMSLLPLDTNTYPQMPYEKISKPVLYSIRQQQLEHISRANNNFDDLETQLDATPELFCTNDHCQLK